MTVHPFRFVRATPKSVAVADQREGIAAKNDTTADPAPYIPSHSCATLGE
jgi:hypothetical protein